MNLKPLELFVAIRKFIRVNNTLPTVDDLLKLGFETSFVQHNLVWLVSNRGGWIVGIKQEETVFIAPAEPNYIKVAMDQKEFISYVTHNTKKNSLITSQLNRYNVCKKYLHRLRKVY